VPSDQVLTVAKKENLVEYYKIKDKAIQKLAYLF
jgi:hypothetical protein